MTQLSPYLELAVLARFDVSPLLTTGSRWFYLTPLGILIQQPLHRNHEAAYPGQLVTVVTPT